MPGRPQRRESRLGLQAAEGPESAPVQAGCSPAPPCLLPWQAAQSQGGEGGDLHRGDSSWHRKGTPRGAGGMWSFEPHFRPNPLPILALARGFVLQNSTSSWKKEPKLLKWSPASPRPQGRPRPQPQTPPAGRSQNGQRMPSSPCELVCGSAPQTAGHLLSPRST